MKLMKIKLTQLKSFAVRKMNEFDAYIDRGMLPGKLNTARYGCVLNALN